MIRFALLTYTLLVIGTGICANSMAVTLHAAEDERLADGQQFFEKKIRPILVAECYACHSAEKMEGGLALDNRAATQRGGDRGEAVVPGKVAESLLIAAIRHAEDDLHMPPKKKLSDEVIADFERWIELGAPDPRDGEAHSYGIDIEEGRQHWAFQVPRQPEVPPVQHHDWPVSDIDRFVLASLEASDLMPVADTDRRTLLRRLSFDLIGLPPTAEEIEAFVSDDSADAFEKVVDRLLASPHFGEKWGRHWLDVARYAESTGSTVNFLYPHAWRYRDYVIDAFNDDKPYDEFVKEQLAGDLMRTRDPDLQAERMIATGFLALGAKSLSERSGLKYELDMADEQIDVTSQAFLGVTAACARCHDHKFDPIPQSDYYALSGIFRSTETCYGTIRFINARRPSGLLTLPQDASVDAGVPRLSARERERIEDQLVMARESVQSVEDPIQRFLRSGRIDLLRAKLAPYEEDGEPKRLAMGVRDKRSGPDFRRRQFGYVDATNRYTYDGSRTIANSPVYIRGEADQPESDRVPRGTLQVLTDSPLRISYRTSGRLELAEWIASRENPLTARVMVNRVWLHLFGQGLVPTPNDFGLAGRPASHPELLDHLAVHFMDNGWSVKELIRYMVTSRVYQLSSSADPKAIEIDPDNVLSWRMAPRRLDAESLRDAMLAASGQLDPERPMGSLVARQGEGPAEGRGIATILRLVDDPRDNHRSIYLPLVRDNLPESLALFDGADPSLVTPDRQQTTVPAQGLYLLNNEFVIRVSNASAERLLKIKSDDERIESAFQSLFGRRATREEHVLAREFLDEYYNEAAPRGLFALGEAEREKWSAFCQALFASAEFQYRK